MQIESYENSDQTSERELRNNQTSQREREGETKEGGVRPWGRIEGEKEGTFVPRSLYYGTCIDFLKTNDSRSRVHFQNSSEMEEAGLGKLKECYGEDDLEATPAETCSRPLPTVGDKIIKQIRPSLRTRHQN